MSPPDELAFPPSVSTRDSCLVLTPATSGVQKLADGFLILLFLAMIFLPLVDMVSGLDGTPVKEKRTLAPVPSAITSLLSTEKSVANRLKEFIDHSSPLLDQSKQYIRDHFGFRKLLIHHHALVQVKLLRASPTQKVLIGMSDLGTADDPSGQWLFYNGEQVLEHYHGEPLFSNVELEQWRQLLEHRRDTLKEKRTRYILVITPNKHTIYPEYLPAHLKRSNVQTRTDQLISYLKESSDINIIDTRVPLWEAKKRHPHLRLYHRTDTHWNQIGAFVAYELIAQKLSMWYPTIQPRTINDFEVVYLKNSGGDLAAFLGIQTHFEETHLTLSPLRPIAWPEQVQEPGLNRIRTRTGLTTQPRLVMFHDSFGLKLIPLLSSHFETALFCRYNESDELVDDEMADIVIDQVIERQLMSKPLELGRLPDDPRRRL